MKNYCTYICVYFCLILSIKAQNRTDISGTYKFGTDIEKESVGYIYLVPHTENTFFMRLEVSKAAPSYSTSLLFTKLTINNNSAEYLSDANKGCYLKFTLSENKITIKDESTSQWGSAWVGRTYNKTNNDIPKFFYLGNGDKIPFSEDSNHFSENYFNKTSQYIWGEALCDYTGTYHAKDFNDVQLQRAFEISDTYNTDQQNVFSSWYNLKSETEIDEKIAYFEKRYASIKKEIKSLEQLPVNNNELWDTYIADNLKAIDDLRPIHKLLLRSYYNPNSLIESKYYPLIKDAVPVLNSNNKAIKTYYNQLTINDTEKVSTIDQMRKHIYYQKIHNVLLNTITSRSILFSKLFISIKEECSDGPY